MKHVEQTDSLKTAIAKIGVEGLQQEPFNISTDVKGDLTLLRYEMRETNLEYRCVQEARGIIFNSKNEVVCRSFNKFFNLGESRCWSTPDMPVTPTHRISVKYDGSMVRFYYYNDEWNVATSGKINAKDVDIKVRTEKLSNFYDGILDVILSTYKCNSLDEFMKRFGYDDYRNMTHVFEFIHPNQPIVINYNGLKDLKYIGSFTNEWNTHFKLVAYKPEEDTVPAFGWAVRGEPFSVVQEWVDEQNKNGFEFEGVVVHDIISNKWMKIKSTQYVENHFIGSYSVANDIVRLFVNNELEEFDTRVSDMPEHIRDIYNTFVSGIDKIASDIKSVLVVAMSLSKIGERRDVWAYVSTNSPYASTIMSMLDKGDTDPLPYIRRMSYKTLKQTIYNVTD
jgi:hypothetical protein